MRLFDLHCDTLYACTTRSLPLEENGLSVSLEQGAGIAAWVQTFAVWIPDDVQDKADLFARQVRLFQSFLRRYPNRLRQYDGTVVPGVCNAMLSVESCSFLTPDLQGVQLMKQLGVKLATLTWNGQNALAGGAHSDGRLTSLGRRAVAAMEEAGITIDVSHLSDESFYDVLDCVKNPVVASHSNARYICDVKRNLTDDQIRTVGQSGGLIGLNFYRDFLSPSPPDVDCILRHCDRILLLAGENAVAIGSDFDGSDVLDAIKNVGAVYKLYQAMVKLYGSVLVNRILFQNAQDFFGNARNKERK